MVPRPQYFMLQLISGDVPDQLAYQAHKGSVWLTANTKLADGGLAAHLRSEDLARRAAEALTPILKKRRGESASIRVVPATGGGGGRSAEEALERRINRDSTLMEARLAQRVFAPNKRPVLPGAAEKSD